MKLFEVLYPMITNDRRFLVLAETREQAIYLTNASFTEYAGRWFDQDDLEDRMARAEVSVIFEDVQIPGVKHDG